VTWQGYARDGGLDLAGNLVQAARAFREKFGYPALATRWAGAVILAGPVGEIPQPAISITSRAAVASRTAVELTAAQAADRAEQLALALGVT